MRKQISSIIVLIVFSFSQCLKGQSFIDAPDVGSRPEALQVIFNLNFPDHHLKKIHGRQYLNLYTTALGHQFFKSETPFEGILYTLDDTIYCSHIFYDIHRDKLIAYQQAFNALIELEGEFIRCFKLFEKDCVAEYEFMKVELNKDISGIRRTGFFQVLYESEKLDLFRKHYKVHSEVLYGENYQVRFSLHERLVMRKNNLYFPVRNRRDILKVYPEVEAELKRYLRRCRINFKHASDQQLYQVALFLDKMQLESDRSNTE